jgi:cardiolipin synthase A/B
VDGRIGYVTGLCIGHSWVGDPKRGVEPWRDTGVEIQGPAVADIEHAFAQMWSILGSPLRTNDLGGGGVPGPAGDVALRIIASYPNMGGLYRFDQLIGALARQTIWLTDAYFVGTAHYNQALRAAAMDGVDVRLLLPRTNDVPIVRTISRAGYRTLLEAGVRIFEWNGSMLHAKTAVADGRWARVGSSNLNIASWLGNWELDVVIEDEGFAHQMEEMYLNDLGHATEIVLSPRQKVRLTGHLPRRPRHLKMAEGSGSRAVTGLLRVGNTVGAAITSRRGLGPAETGVLTLSAAVLLCVVIIGALWPLAISIPVIVFCVWVVFALLVRAYRLRTNRDQ